MKNNDKTKKQSVIAPAKIDADAVVQGNGTAAVKVDTKAKKDALAPSVLEPKYWTYLKLLPIATFILSILMVRLHVYYRPLNQYYWTNALDITQLTDIYAYFKMVVIVASAGLALVFMLLDVLVFKQKLRNNKAFIFIGIYSLLVVLSCIFSKHKNFAVYGAMDRFEGTITILSYMIVLCYIILMVKKPSQVKCLIGVLCVALAILGWIGYKQAQGEDPFMTVWGQKLITPNAQLTDGRTSWEAIDELAEEGQTSYQSRIQTGTVYQTVYNQNYVPFYISAVLPILAMMLAYLWKKTETEGSFSRLLGIFVFGGLFALSLYSFYHSGSAGGAIGVIASGICAIIIFNVNLRKILEPGFALLLVFCIMTVNGAGAWQEQWTQIKSTWKSVFPEKRVEETSYDLRYYFVDGSLERFADADPDTIFEKKPASVRPKIDYIITGEDYVEMSFNGNPFRTEVYQNGGIAFFDGEGEPVMPRIYDEEDRIYEFVDARYHDYLKFTYFFTEDGNSIVIRLTTRDKDWDYRFDMVNGGVYLQTMAGKETSVGLVESMWFENNLNFGSNRGYIWSRSIPLLKHYPIWGAGADCFVAVFPQNDYAYRYFGGIGRYMWNFYEIVDKPHDLFLQISINTGCASLITWLGLVIYYAVIAIKGRFRFDSFASFAQAGCFLGVIAFLGSAIPNDGSVSTMPMFYTILGLGIAIAGFEEKGMLKEKPAGKHSKKSKSKKAGSEIVIEATTEIAETEASEPIAINDTAAKEAAQTNG